MTFGFVERLAHMEFLLRLIVPTSPGPEPGGGNKKVMRLCLKVCPSLMPVCALSGRTGKRWLGGVLRIQSGDYRTISAPRHTSLIRGGLVIRGQREPGCGAILLHPSRIVQNVRCLSGRHDVGIKHQNCPVQQNGRGLSLRPVLRRHSLMQTPNLQQQESEE